MTPLPRTRLLALVVGCTCVLSTAAQARSYYSDTMKDQGEVLEVVGVPQGAGDGAITMRDFAALAEFTTWCFDRLIQTQDASVALDASADDHAVTFWSYIWGGLDQESKVLISQMDVIWPAARKNWAAANGQQRAEITANIRNLVIAIWGEQTALTASFLAEEISYDAYVPVMDAILAGMAGAQQGVGGDGGEGGRDQEQFDSTLHDALSTHLGNFIEY